MHRLFKLTAFAAGLSSAIPVFTRAYWKESGWISTCAGIGCTGMRSICAMRSYTNSEGDKVTTYCYLDP